MSSDDSGTVQEPVSLTNGEPMASSNGSTCTFTSSQTQDLESPTLNVESLTQNVENHAQSVESPTQNTESLAQNLESLRKTLSSLRLKQERVKHHTKFLTLHADQQSFPKGFQITLPVQVPNFENSDLQREISSLQTEIGTRLRNLVLKHYKNLAKTIEAKIESTKKNEHV